MLDLEHNRLSHHNWCTIIPQIITSIDKSSHTTDIPLILTGIQ